MANTRSPSETVASGADLRGIYKPPSRGAVAKEIPRLDRHCRRFIELSPFLCLGTMGPDSRADVSPRGGEPGFVHVIDETHIAIPDRPGNNRLDSFTNLLHDPGVALLFLVPGFEDVLRVNGLGRVTTDPELMARFTADGKPPRTVLVVEVREAQLHCGKAVRRAGLWDPAAQLDRASTFPNTGEVLRDQLNLDMEARIIDEAVEKDARENLY
ncbi:pyridoxamine 5'-phosphate oxidase family protein [Phenylobacterium terrae]|uniref:Pyridoxamine 5'-phosphate oxidase family protein n=1 Tax=Phenylobacterium terrae TaxID=2665495 RepID=A0ABW4N2N5_9CAUL